VRLNHITLAVGDVKASADFYAGDNRLDPPWRLPEAGADR
jgi:catechol 2,3-dioxygenase-like lactoylglutathione lyase family enzyme